MKKFLFAFIFSSLFLSCSEKILELHDMDYMHSDVIPIDEALSTLNAQIEQLYGITTKSLTSDYDVRYSEKIIYRPQNQKALIFQILLRIL